MAKFPTFGGNNNNNNEIGRLIRLLIKCQVTSNSNELISDKSRYQTSGNSKRIVSFGGLILYRHEYWAPTRDDGSNARTSSHAGSPSNARASPPRSSFTRTSSYARASADATTGTTREIGQHIQSEKLDCSTAGITS
uniref:Uncharacterized protein n=1 Tax=Cacopsylla melanoneura TaxID=428564 RepID=A0A8D8UWX8_9HEMI